jgi:DNA uptake protein ComE-like DNA-binding protein
MKLQTKLVAVKRINSSMARSSFSADAIEKVAHLMINAEGIINPIILRQHSLESYEVIDGHFEYHAAVRAKEISLLKGETIQAIILEPDNEEILIEQVNILRRNPAPESPVVEDYVYTGEAINSDQVVNIESQFINLERVFKAQFDELQKSNRRLESRVSELATQNPKSNNLKLNLEDELITQIAAKVVESLAPLFSSLQKQTRNPDQSSNKHETYSAFPLDLNEVSEKQLCLVNGIREATAKKIVKERNSRGRFSSVEELSTIAGISLKTIRAKEWHRYLEVRDSNN